MGCWAVRGRKKVIQTPAQLTEVGKCLAKEAQEIAKLASDIIRLQYPQMQMLMKSIPEEFREVHWTLF